MNKLFIALLLVASSLVCNVHSSLSTVTTASEAKAAMAKSGTTLFLFHWKGCGISRVVKVNDFLKDFR